MIGQVQCRNCNFYQVQAKNIRIHPVTRRIVPNFGGVVLNWFGNILLGFIAFVVIGFIIAGLAPILSNMMFVGFIFKILDTILFVALIVSILIFVLLRSHGSYNSVL